ncbi:MAG: EamA family transporter [Nitrospinota bacterium]
MGRGQRGGLRKISVPPALLALASMAVQSLADCVYKRSQVKGAVPETFLVYQSYSFGVTAFALVLAQGAFRSDLTAWKYGPACGLVGFAAYYFFLRSLKGGQVSVNTMIFRLSFVLTALLAIVFLGEPVTVRKVSGLAVAGLAVAALTIFPALRKKAGGAGAAEGTAGEKGRSLAFALAALACLGTLSFFYKLAAREGVPAPALIFIQFAFFSPSAMVYAAFRRRFLRHPVSIGHGLGAGVLLSLALILLVSALMRGEAGIMVPINQMSFVLTAAFAVPWFGEAWTAPKTVAVLLAAGAVFLLSG